MREQFLLKDQDTRKPEFRVWVNEMNLNTRRSTRANSVSLKGKEESSQLMALFFLYRAVRHSHFTYIKVQTAVGRKSGKEHVKTIVKH